MVVSPGGIFSKRECLAFSRFMQREPHNRSNNADSQKVVYKAFCQVKKSE